MDICFTVSSLKFGGAERVVTTLCNRFAELGHNVTIVLVSINHIENVFELNDKIKLVPLCEGYSKKVKFFKRVGLLKECIKKINPNIVIAFLPHICVYSYFATKSLGIPLICSERNDPNQYSFVYKVLLKKAFSKADGCVFQTNDAMQFYGKKVAKKSVIINNPINPKFCCQNIPSKRSNAIVAVGRLEAQKNYDLLIESFSLFCKSHKGYVLKIYGEGSLKKHIEELISKNDLNDKVFIMGTNDNWLAEENNASIFVMTSLYEGMPNALAEALISGIPSVSTNCPIGGPKKLSEYCDYLFLVENNSNSICQAMENCLHIKNVDNTKIYQAMNIETVANEWIHYIEKISNYSKR